MDVDDLLIDEINKQRSAHEPLHQWELKKKFMLTHRKSFSLRELVGLAQTFGNIEFMGCIYPEDTMRKVTHIGLIKILLVYVISILI